MGWKGTVSRESSLGFYQAWVPKRNSLSRNINGFYDQTWEPKRRQSLNRRHWVLSDGGTKKSIVYWETSLGSIRIGNHTKTVDRETSLDFIRRGNQKKYSLSRDFTGFYQTWIPKRNSLSRDIIGYYEKWIPKRDSLSRDHHWNCSGEVTLKIAIVLRIRIE